MSGEIVKLFDEPVETVSLVVSVFDDRCELEVPKEIVSDMSRLTSYLRESEVPVPSDPTLTLNASGAYILHEQPVFG